MHGTTTKGIYLSAPVDRNHSKNRRIDMSNHHHHKGNNQNFMAKIEFLDSQARKRTLPPEEILNMLPLRNGDSILDVGSGSGYLTIPAAQQTDGIVFALDIDKRMLQVIHTKAAAKNITNIQLIEGNIESIPLPDGSVDGIIASLILHEVPSLPAAISEMNRVLKTDGHLLCLEYEKEECHAEGPPVHIRIPSADMAQALISAGFNIERNIAPKQSIYIITAKKASNAR